MNNLHKIARHMAGSDKQSGQAIVLIGMLIIVLIASLGLAIDGGGMYLLWRDAQNAADTAAIQAAYAYCTSQKNTKNEAIAAGMTAIYDNSFKDYALPALAPNQDDWTMDDKLAAAGPIDDAGTAQDEFLNSNAMYDAIVGKATELGYTAANLPTNGSNINNIILVKIRAKKPAFFIQVVYGGPLSVTATALGACNPGGSSPYAGYAMFSTATYGPDCTKPELDNTGSYTYVEDSIYANYDLNLSGSDLYLGDEAQLSFGNTADTNVVLNDQDPNDTELVNDFGEPVDTFPPLYTFDQFVDDPGDPDDIASKIKAIDPAYYTYKDGNYTLKNDVEGLYVVNGNINMGSGANQPVPGNLGITLVAKGQISGGNGSVNDGASAWQPFALNDITEKILMFTDWTGPCNAGGGQSGINFSGSGIFGRGLLYAPNSHINLQASETVWCGALISRTMSPAGDGKWFFAGTIPDKATLLSYPINQPPQNPFPIWIADAYNGANCDYLPDPEPPSFFLGDLQG